MKLNQDFFKNVVSITPLDINNKRVRTTLDISILDYLKNKKEIYFYPYGGTVAFSHIKPDNVLAASKLTVTSTYSILFNLPAKIREILAYKFIEKNSRGYNKKDVVAIYTDGQTSHLMVDILPGTAIDTSKGSMAIVFDKSVSITDILRLIVPYSEEISVYVKKRFIEVLWNIDYKTIENILDQFRNKLWVIDSGEKRCKKYKHLYLPFIDYGKIVMSREEYYRAKYELERGKK